jgi:hypothetical protein
MPYGISDATFTRTLVMVSNTGVSRFMSTPAAS